MLNLHSNMVLLKLLGGDIDDIETLIFTFQYGTT